MKWDKIDKWSPGYWFVKNIFVKWSYKSYFRNFSVKNLHRVPADKAVIFAPNHQNALMDALSIVVSNKQQAVFIARADIFKNPVISRILTFLKIIPMYRMRDGAVNLKKNEEIFNLTLRILRKNKTQIVIFPEGNHGDKRRLRPLVKGIFRMAFRVQEDYGDKPGVMLQPVGLDYGHYQNFGSTLLVNYGEPFDISEYYTVYRENPAVGINRLRERLSGEMKKYMIHIEPEEYYDLYMDLRRVYNDRMRQRVNIKGKSLYDRFRADKKMIELLEKYRERDTGKLDNMNVLMKQYRHGVSDLNLRDWVFRKKKYSLLLLTLEGLGLVLLFPLFVLGLINNYIPYKVPSFTIKNIKDAQFHSSVKYGAGLIIVLLYYLLLMILAIIFIRPLWLMPVYILTIPFTGHFAFRYAVRWKKLLGRFRYAILVKRGNRKILDLQKIRNDITGIMDEIQE